MRALALLAAMALAGGGSGATVRAVSDMPRPMFAMQGRAGAAANGATLLSKVMSRGGRVLSLDWTQTTPGIDGIGAGNNVFRIALVVTPEGGAPITACVLDVACDAPAGDATTTCTDANYSAGSDVDVRITSQPCLGVPSGFPAIDAEMTRQ